MMIMITLMIRTLLTMQIMIDIDDDDDDDDDDDAAKCSHLMQPLDGSKWLQLAATGCMIN